MRKGVIVVVVVGFAAAVGFIAQRQLSETTAAPVAPVAKPAAAPATTPPTSADAKPAQVIPDTLPQIELTDRDGKKRNLGDWKGRPLMVNYWATWCPPCRREIPLLNKLRAEHKAMNLEIIGIAIDFREDVLKYAQEHPISYPLLIDDDEKLVATKSMGMLDAPFPFTVFVDSRQRILTLKVGELFHEDAELILGRLKQVDAGTLPLPEARQQITEGLKELDIKRAAEKAAKAPKAATG